MTIILVKLLIVLLVVPLYNNSQAWYQYQQQKDGILFTGKNPTYAQAKIKLFAHSMAYCVKQ